MDVVIVGAGVGGRKLLEALVDHPEVTVRCVMDAEPEAPGMQLARERGIPVATDYRSVLAHPAATPFDLILEATGQPAIYAELERFAAAAGASVISGTALRFFMLLLEDKLQLIDALQAEQKLATEVMNLREVQTLLEAIIQSTQDAISVVDAEGRGILINPAYTRLTGLRPEQVIGKPADVDIAEGESMHLRVIRTQKPVRNIPLKVGPAKREVLVDVAPILVGGELKGSVGVIHDVSEIKRLTDELRRANHLIRSVQAKYTFEDIIGHSPAMLLAKEQALRAAQTPATVLLRGESGTGKELFAHAIHHESDRSGHPFIRVNCAALSESLLESELFGYEEGAFTGARRGGRAGLFEEASGGTLFLDEIGEMTPATQAKLLRALQEQEIVRVGGTRPISVDVRLIAATHVHLEQSVAKGLFREDLYYRLNVLPILIPPLRYRREDIEEISRYILYRHNQTYGRNVERLAPATVAALQAYDWPGNVRELENVIGRAMIHMAYHETVMEAHHLPSLQRMDAGANARVPDAWLGWGQSRLPLQEIMRRLERAVILQTLEQTDGNKTEAARRLGISLRSLYYKLSEVSDTP
ncbi:MAG: sigma 54-interacting transcriptional regulator [Alicyclobacillus sp.]|nr:sigma 54-interacting transcriptional regulator [Alicyclobacillus sp.]